MHGKNGEKVPKFEDLKVVVNDSDVIVGLSKDRKVYGLSYKTGELFEVENGSVNPMWGSCTVEYAKQKQAEIKAGLKVA